MNIIARVRTIVAEVLELAPEKVGTTDALIDEHGMDSLMAFDIALALESQFAVKFEDQQLRRFVTVEAITEIVASQLAPKADC